MEGEIREAANSESQVGLDPSFVISIASLIIALISLYFTSLQSSYSADQTLVSKKALEVSAAGLELAKEEADRNNRHSVVYDGQFLEAVDGPLKNGVRLKLSFSNMAAGARSYRVGVVADGFGVYWPGDAPEKLQSAIYLDRHSIVVGPNERYVEDFVVWHSTEPPKKASLAIVINDTLELFRTYEYSEKYEAYVLVSG